MPPLPPLATVDAAGGGTAYSVTVAVPEVQVPVEQKLNRANPATSAR